MPQADSSRWPMYLAAVNTTALRFRARAAALIRLARSSFRIASLLRRNARSGR